MKYSIYKIIFGLSLFVCITSCKCDDEGPTGEVDEFESISELVESLKTEGQTIIIADPTVEQSFTGKDGTVINIGALAFFDGTGPVSTPVTARLNEYLKKESLETPFSLVIPAGFELYQNLYCISVN